MRKVILVGGNHLNGLGLVRSIGIHGIKPYGLIIGAENSGFLQKSKYWESLQFIPDPKAAVEVLLRDYSHEEEKPIVIPYLDDIAAEIDRNYNTLSEFFVLPSIGEKQGEIIRMMDKQVQHTFAREHGINVLASEIVCIDTPQSSIPYPRILKPVLSNEGAKFDIEICHDEKEYICAIDRLKGKNRGRILVEQYLTDYIEYCITRVVTERKTAFSAIEKHRRWPNRIGVTSFGETINEAFVNEFATAVLKQVQKLGYFGLIDMDVFRVGQDEFYLNEINWRSSGNNYVSLITGLSPITILIDEINKVDVNVYNKHSEVLGFLMYEAYDLRHVLMDKDVSFFEWFSDIRRTKSFAFWWGKDPCPALYEYRRLILAALKK